MSDTVIITFNMVPFTALWGGSQRMYFLANQLGCDEEVSIFCCDQGYFQEYESLKVHHNVSINPIKMPFKSLQKYVENRFTSSVLNSGDGRKSKKRFSWFQGIVKYIDKSIFNEFGFLGVVVLVWVIGLCANNIFRNKIFQAKNIIISGPYFTTFLVSLFIRLLKKRQIKIILDYRDPWNQVHKGSVVSRFLETVCIRCSNHLVLFSNEFAHNFDNYRIPIEIVYNGYDENNWKDVRSEVPVKKSRIQFVYASSHTTFSHGSGRDLTMFLSRLSKLSLLEKKNAKVTILGCIDTPKVDYCHAFLEVEFKGRINNRAALQLLSNSDVNLTIDTSEVPSKYTITGKLFDLLRAEKCIYAISNSHEIGFIKFLKQYDYEFYFSNNSADQIDKIILQLLKKTEFTVKYAGRSEYTRTEQNKKFIEILSRPH